MKNATTQALAMELKKLAIEQQRPLWKRIAVDLEKPTRQRRIVNLWRVEQHVKDGDMVVVPGKLLGDGVLTKKVTIAAAGCSLEARNKIAAAGGTFLSLNELMKKQPDGKNIKVLG